MAGKVYHSVEKSFGKWTPLVLAAILILPMSWVLLNRAEPLANPLSHWTENRITDDTYESYLRTNRSVPNVINVTLWNPDGGDNYHLFRMIRGNWTGYRYEYLNEHAINETLSVRPGLFKIVQGALSPVVELSPGVFGQVTGKRIILHSEGQRINLGVLS